MKKIFGVLLGTAAAVSLTACDDEDRVYENGTGTAYSLDATGGIVYRSTVTVSNNVFDVEFDAFYSLSDTDAFVSFYEGEEHIYTGISGYSAVNVNVGAYEASGSHVNVYDYLDISGVIYTFNESVYEAAYSADNTATLSSGYESVNGTLAEYEASYLSDEDAAINFITAYEAGEIRVVQSASTDAEGFVAHGKYGNLNKSHADSTYWPSEQGGLGWDANIEAIEGAFESKPSLFDVDFSDTDVELGSATVNSMYNYAAIIQTAYNVYVDSLSA